MLDHIQAAPPRLKQRGFSFFIGVIASLTLMTILSSNAQAATPLAGSVISNQASANYKDSGGTPQTATSNSVTTTVAQVGSYTLTANNTKTAAPGTTVYMPHILTNTGNGADTFYVTLPTAIDGDLSGVAIYADVNGDGQPDSPTPLCTTNGTANNCSGTNVSTGSLASGGSFKFVVAMTVKSTAADAAAASEVATAVPDSTTSWYSTYSPNSINNTDNLTVANNVPVFAVNKSIISSLTSGPANTDVTYKLAYTNSGNAAGPLYINDVMGNGATNGFSYQIGSAKWSVSGTTALDDATGATGDPSGIEYQAVTTGTQTTITALIANVPANASGFITFTVKVDSDAPLGTSETTNVASYARANNGANCATIADCTTTPPTTITTTNQSPFTVTGTYNVVANNNTGSSTDETDDNAATGVNVVTASATAPNTVVSFSNVIWNTGTASDTFNITYDATNAGATGSPTNFPTGTTFQLFKSDGVTPLTSSDADGIPDTGPVDAGSPYTVVLKASIPANACNLVNCDPLTGDKNFTVTKIAASKADPSKTNKVFDQLAAITPPSVDLTNVGTLGQGPGSVASPAITNVSVAPGQTAYFNLNVTNGGLANDNYNLAYQIIDTTGGDLASASAFSAGALPAGWSVSFHVNTAGTGACSAGTLGAVVNNTGVIGPTATSTTANLCAAVTTPSGTSALSGLYRTYFRVLSTATLVSDIKLDSVTLSAINNLTLTPPGSGQIQPGGTIVYPHILANGGNTSCGGDFTFNVSNSQAASGWSYTLYLDNGSTPDSVDAGDTVLGGGTNATDIITTTLPALTAGTSTKLLVKVQAPSGATSGSVDAISITATDTVLSCGTTTPIADNTTILAGQIRLIKTQALGTWTGTDCGTAPAASSFASATLSQKPGECVWYKVVATNEGDASVTDVAINDATPAYTTYGGGGICTGGTASVAGVALSGAGATSTGSTGSVLCSTWSTVNPSETAQLLFSVRINQ